MPTPSCRTLILAICVCAAGQQHDRHVVSAINREDYASVKSNANGDILIRTENEEGDAYVNGDQIVTSNAMYKAFEQLCQTSFPQAAARNSSCRPTDMVVALSLQISSQNTNDLAFLKDVDCLDGNLEITSGDTEIPWLKLKTITGNLRFVGTTYTKIHWLGNLESIGGDLQFVGNSDLKTIDGLNRLTHVGGKVSLVDNSALTNIDGLESLSVIGVPPDGVEPVGDDALSLQISANPLLQNIDKLSLLSYVGGSVDINRNPVLENLDGLSGLETIGQHLFVSSNSALASLDGLESLKSVVLFVVVCSNPALNSIPSYLTDLGTENFVCAGGCDCPF